MPPKGHVQKERRSTCELRDFEIRTDEIVDIKVDPIQSTKDIADRDLIHHISKDRASTTRCTFRQHCAQTNDQGSMICDPFCP